MRVDVDLQHFPGGSLDAADRLPMPAARRIAGIEFRRADLGSLNQRDRRGWPTLCGDTNAGEESDQ